MDFNSELEKNQFHHHFRMCEMLKKKTHTHFLQYVKVFVR